MGEKKGQIAHLDKDPANNAEDNLAFLCLDHHDQYDSKTSQSKGLTLKEVKVYRSRLYVAVETGVSKAFSEDASKQDGMLTHDREIFDRANEILPESHLRDFLDCLQTYDSFTRKGFIPIKEFILYFEEVGNHFLLSGLAAPIKEFLRSLKALHIFLIGNFFIYPENSITDDNCQYALYPDLNVDRRGCGDPEEMAMYGAYQVELDRLCGIVRENYKQYRLAVKRRLLR